MSFEKKVKDLIDKLEKEDKKFLLYGATGYTGKLIIDLIGKMKCESLVVLGGRSEDKVKQIAKESNIDDYTSFSLNNVNVICNIFRDYKINAVLNAAGPFSKTAKPMIDACLKSGVSYLDITGEIDVFEYSLADKEKRKTAEEKDVCIMSGVGFDVVPTDCLAKKVADEFNRKYDENASNVDIAISFGSGMQASRGTLKTMVEMVGKSGGCTVERKNEKFHHVPMYKNVKHFKFEPSGRVERCFQVPWGDVSTAYHSTNVPNISVYFSGAPPALFVTIFRLFMLHWLLWLIFKIPFIISILQKLIERFLPAGPDEKSREDESNRCEITVVAKNKDGSKQVVGVAKASSGYKFTAQSALLSTLRVLSGDVEKYGCVTPSTAFGSDFLAEMDHCSLKIQKH